MRPSRRLAQRATRAMFLVCLLPILAYVDAVADASPAAVGYVCTPVVQTAGYATCRSGDTNIAGVCSTAAGPSCPTGGSLAAGICVRTRPRLSRRHCSRLQRQACFCSLSTPALPQTNTFWATCPPGMKNVAGVCTYGSSCPLARRLGLRGLPLLPNML